MLNIDWNDQGVLAKYQQEIQALRTELQEKSKNILDKKVLTSVPFVVSFWLAEKGDRDCPEGQKRNNKSL